MLREQVIARPLDEVFAFSMDVVDIYSFTIRWPDSAFGFGS